MQKCARQMLDVTKMVNVDDSVKNIDLSKCCTTESLLLTKLWNDDDDIMALLIQRVSNSMYSNSITPSDRMHLIKAKPFRCSKSP